MNVGFISLGCSKNLVVTEALIGVFKRHGYNLVNNPGDADIIIVNTCGFIESAKEEAINTLLEMADYKKDKCKYLIAMGCLVERYKKELEKNIPEIDLFISIKEYPNIWNLISKLINHKEENDKLNFLDRYITTGNITAYLKIAEGCSNACAYCAIPKIQGKYISRPFESIIEEAKKLAKDGYKEIVLIAQDTTKYGKDLYGEYRLAELMHEISKITSIKWIRFLYAYPETLSQSIIDEVKNNPKIIHYFDIPIQHISDKILKKMNRTTTSKDIKNLINKIRKEIPDAIIRTTLIAGFPGEDEKDFNELCDFVKNANIDKLGCFAFSKEEGTIAYYMDNQIPKKIKNERKNKIMEIQQSVSRKLMLKRIGNIYDCLIEDITDDGSFYIGRTYMDVPDEDGIVYIQYEEGHMINTFEKVKIIRSLNYDLVGQFIKEE